MATSNCRGIGERPQSTTILQSGRVDHANQSDGAGRARHRREQGLGARFARVLAANGALTVLAARRVESLKDLRAEIERPAATRTSFELDVTEPDSIRAAVAHTEPRSARSTSWSTTPASSTTQRLTEATPDDYDYVFDTNVKGAFFVAQEVASA